MVHEYEWCVRGNFMHYFLSQQLCPREVLQLWRVVTVASETPYRVPLLRSCPPLDKTTKRSVCPPPLLSRAHRIEPQQ